MPRRNLVKHLGRAARSDENKIARLRRELDEARGQQTATAEVLKVISGSTFDLQTVFDTVAENAVRSCGAERAYIFQFDGELLRAIAAYNVAPRIGNSYIVTLSHRDDTASRHAQPSNGEVCKFLTFRLTLNMRMSFAMSSQFGRASRFRCSRAKT